METIIVSRNAGFVQFVKSSMGLECPVMETAAPETISGKHIIGVLPHSLSCHAGKYTEVPLSLTPEMRGKKLTAEETAEIAGDPVSYKVKNQGEVKIEDLQAEQELVLVTRHKGLVDYFHNLGVTFSKVISHASEEEVRGKVVVGVLPHALSSLTDVMVELPLRIPRELWGQELSAEQVGQYCGTLTEYHVSKM